MKLTQIADNMKGQFRTVVQKAAGAVHSRLDTFINQKGGTKNRKFKKTSRKTKKKILRKKSKKMKGGNINGPYAALMNKTSAYARYGAPGQKYWHNGINIQGSSIGGPTPIACHKKIGGRRNRKYLFKH